MNHHDFLHLSLEISKIDPQPEALTRNGIGRLYYFCYHEALNLINSVDDLKSIYDSLDKMGSHKKVTTTFANYVGKSKNLKYGAISRLLKDMHELRCDADYHIEKDINRSILISMLANLKSLKDLLTDMNSSYFQVDIEVYIPARIQIIKKKKSSLKIVE